MAKAVGAEGSFDFPPTQHFLRLEKNETVRKIFWVEI